MLIVLRENSARHQRDTERTQKELVAEKLKKKFQIVHRTFNRRDFWKCMLTWGMYDGKNH